MLKKSKTYIYCLLDSKTQKPFYIGKTNNPQRRLNEHIAESKRGKGHNAIKEKYIRQLLSKGIEIILKILAIVVGEYKAVETFYIETFSLSYELVNVETIGK